MVLLLHESGRKDRLLEEGWHQDQSFAVTQKDKSAKDITLPVKLPFSFCRSAPLREDEV